jgi:hypothetical protein
MPNAQLPVPPSIVEKHPEDMFVVLPRLTEFFCAEIEIGKALPHPSDN